MSSFCFRCVSVPPSKTSKNLATSRETEQGREPVAAVPRSLWCSRWEQVRLPAVCLPWLGAHSESGRASEDSLATVHGDTQAGERWCAHSQPAGCCCWISRILRNPETHPQPFVRLPQISVGLQNCSQVRCIKRSLLANPLVKQTGTVVAFIHLTPTLYQI